MSAPRIHLRTPALAYLARSLTVLLAAILIWYGAMVVLLAVKVAPHTVNSISAYRTMYDFLAKLRESDFSTLRRLLAGFGGLVAFVLFVYLALQELPRPYLSRREVILSRGGSGLLTIEPRAIERLVEIAAACNGDARNPAAHLDGDSLTLNIGVSSARRAAETLSDVRRRAAADLARHELPDLRVNVTLTKFEPTTRRNLA